MENTDAFTNKPFHSLQEKHFSLWIPPYQFCPLLEYAFVADYKNILFFFIITFTFNLY